MRYTHIRNATGILAHGGEALLIDPYFMGKGLGDSYGGSGVKSPIVDLPVPIPEIVSQVTGVLVTHLHPDHFDEQAQRSLPKDLDIICTPPIAGDIRRLGFASVLAIDPLLEWRGGLSIAPAPAQHGPRQVLYRMGHVVGYVIRATGAPSVYFAGDTILSPLVRETILAERPDVIVMNAGGAFSRGKDGPIIMDAAQVAEVLMLAPWATGIAVHLGATDHCRVTRQSLRAHVDATGAAVSSRLVIPDDGETLDLPIPTP